MSYCTEGLLLVSALPKNYIAYLPDALNGTISAQSSFFSPHKQHFLLSCAAIERRVSSNRAGLARRNWQKEEREILFLFEVIQYSNSPLGKKIAMSLQPFTQMSNLLTR
jgi:hypothetical protein